MRIEDTNRLTLRVGSRRPTCRIKSQLGLRPRACSARIRDLLQSIVECASTDATVLQLLLLNSAQLWDFWYYVEYYALYNSTTTNLCLEWLPCNHHACDLAVSGAAAVPPCRQRSVSLDDSHHRHHRQPMQPWQQPLSYPNGSIIATRIDLSLLIRIQIY